MNFPQPADPTVKALLLQAEEIVADHERRVGPLSDEVMEEARRAWSEGE